MLEGAFIESDSDEYGEILHMYISTLTYICIQTHSKDTTQ